MKMNKKEEFKDVEILNVLGKDKNGELLGNDEQLDGWNAMKRWSEERREQERKAEVRHFMGTVKKCIASISGYYLADWSDVADFFALAELYESV